MKGADVNTLCRWCGEPLTRAQRRRAALVMPVVERSRLGCGGMLAAPEEEATRLAKALAAAGHVRPWEPVRSGSRLVFWRRMLVDADPARDRGPVYLMVDRERPHGRRATWKWTLRGPEHDGAGGYRVHATGVEATPGVAKRWADRVVGALGVGATT
jgi:hypothetical protein